MYSFICLTISRLASLTADAACELNVFGHDSHTLGVNGAQVRIFKKTYQVGLSSFLEGQDGRPLKPEITLEILRNLTDQALEGQLAYEKISRLLVPANLTKGNGTRAVTMGLLDTSGRGSGLTGRLCGELLAGCLASGGLASGLLGAGHVGGCFE